MFVCTWGFVWMETASHWLHMCSLHCIFHYLMYKSFQNILSSFRKIFPLKIILHISVVLSLWVLFISLQGCLAIPAFVVTASIYCWKDLNDWSCSPWVTESPSYWATTIPVPAFKHVQSWKQRKKMYSILLYKERSIQISLARRELWKISKYIKDHHLILITPICQPKHMSTWRHNKTSYCYLEYGSKQIA